MNGKKIIALTLVASFLPLLPLHQIRADEPHSEVTQYTPFITQVVPTSITGAIGWQWNNEEYVLTWGDDVGKMGSSEASPANEPVIRPQDSPKNQAPCPGLN